MMYILGASKIFKSEGFVMRRNLEGISEFELAVRDEVKAWMARKGVSQTELAEVLGVSQSNVSYRLRGKTAFVIHDLAIIAGYLGITVADLLGPVGTSPIILPQETENPAQAEAGTGSHETVRPVGLEPTTHGLKVRCSTN
jgi:predicted XRE-type DNA-binding protein